MDVSLYVRDTKLADASVDGNLERQSSLFFGIKQLLIIAGLFLTAF